MDDELYRQRTLSERTGHKINPYISELVILFTEKHMKSNLQKFIIAFFALLFTIEPILQLSQITRAKAEDATAEEEPIADVTYDGTSASAQPESLPDAAVYKISLKASIKTGGTDNIISVLAGIHSEEDRIAGIGLEEALSNDVEARIILNGDDQQALKILWRLSGTWMMPDFEREPEAIFVQYPKFKDKFIKEKKDVYDSITSTLGHEIISVDDIAAIKVANYAQYLDLTHYAQTEWTKNLGDVADEVKKQTDDAINKKTSPDTKVIEMISDVTGETVETINQIFIDNANSGSSNATTTDTIKEKYRNLMDTFSVNIKAVKIDIRVVNMLVYLVTPKTQGGAGHYKIKVKRILSGYTAPKKIFSRESESTLYNLGADMSSDSTTAADYGQNRASDTQTTPATATPQALNSDDPDAFAIVSDSDGESYNAFVSSALAADANFPTAAAVEEENTRNVSAHADGQAVDISEIDDIRCTLIKKRRIGGYQRSKYLQRPIKLAWQTTKGYAENGGGDLYKSDMANVMKSFASDGIADLIYEFGGDLSTYDGDLSSAGFSDIAMLIGKSIFSQVLNSPGANLQGYQFGDTLTQLGGMYMADYLGLPREMFAQGHIPDSYDELAERIGTAAIEKRLDLPIGTFGGTNLKEMLQKVGQRKIEFEMNLTTGSLDNYFKETTSVTSIENKDYLIGKGIIEQELNLPKGSFTGNGNTIPANFAELKNSLGELKVNTAFRDPVYADNMLHIDLGTTEKLVAGTLTPYEYCVNVGRIRLDDTAYGVQYMAAKDASYELEDGTFQKAIDGDAATLVTIGIKMMARVFTTGDDERRAFTLWVENNLTKDPTDTKSCYYEDAVKVTLDPGTPQFKEVTISEEKATAAGLQSGDMFSMFACPNANPRAAFQAVGSKILRDSLVQYYLTPDEKVKFNLLEVNHTFHSTDTDKQFYVTRAYDILNYLDTIKNAWKDDNKDPEYLRMKQVVDEAYANIKAVLDQSMPIVTVDQAKTAGRGIAVATNKLKSDVTALRSGSNRYINKTNGTIIDINKIVRSVSEIIAGKELPDTDFITINQIPANAFIETPDTTVNAPALNSQATPRSSSASLIGLAANKQTFMALLARKMKPADFFLIMASDKVESSLDLPQNSLIYFVQNFEKKGLGTIESFYSAVGQAKIEETFNMPSKYFQGPFINDPGIDAYDFRNDLYALYEYGKYDVEKRIPPKVTTTTNDGTGQLTLGQKTTFKNPIKEAIEKPLDFSTFNASTPAAEITPEIKEVLDREYYITELLWIKTTDSATFDYLVNKAQENYTAQMQQYYKDLGITSKDLEVDIDHIVLNVDKNKLNDKIRTAEQDLLFRMGIAGSYDALKTNNSVAWMSASGRTNQIDKLLNIPSGSTKALFTGERIDSGAGIDSLSKKDKQILVSKMGISPVAIDKLLQFLSGEIPLSELEAKAIDITNLGDNPFLGTSSDDCGLSAFNQNTTTGQMVAGSMVADGWFYFDDSIDTREGKTFGSKIQAENYASEHKEDQRTYIEEIAYGLAKITGQSADALVPRITDFLKGNTDTVFSGTMDQAVNDHIEQTMGVSTGTLNNLFTKTQATAAETPLITYKRAVGRQTVKRTINSKIFSALGIKVDPDLFGGNEFFEIMQGNYSSLWGIAGSMVDQKLNIPFGSTMKILTAKSGSLRTCAIAEVGGSIVGKFVGLDYVSLSGDVYGNIGRSRLEKTLGLSQNSFSGKDITQLINNVGVVNFYLAFQYPIGDVDLNTPLRRFYGDEYAKSIERYSNNFKLKKIKEFLDVNTNLSSNSERQNAYNNLKTAMVAHINETSINAKIANGNDRTKDGKWRQNNWDIDKKEEVLAYLDRIDSIDRSFGITIGTTAAFVYGQGEETIEATQQFACNVQEDGAAVVDPDNAGRIRWDDCNDKTPGRDTLNIRNSDGTVKTTVLVPKTSTHGSGTCECDMEKDPAIDVVYATSTAALTPDLYIKKISSKTLLGVAAYSALDLFGLDMTEAQKQAVAGILTHYSNWVKGGNEGAVKLYDGLSTIFSFHLDTVAGLEGGSIRRMIENPGKIGDVLIPQAARKLDQQLGLNPSDRWSLSGVYARYFNSSPDTNTVKATSEQDCGPEQTAIDEKERQLAVRRKALEDWIDANGGDVAWNATDTPNVYMTGTNPSTRIQDHPDYMTKVREQMAINDERAALQSQKNSCKVGNRYGGATDGDNKTFTVSGDPINNAITKYCSTTTLRDANREMCNDIGTSTGGKVKWKFAWIIITDFASDMISDKIFEATKGTLRMPPEDIKHFFANGDMRYFASALFSFSANTFLNKLSTNDDQREAVPTEMQIPYEMVKLWIVGDSGAENYSAYAAAANFNYLDPTTPDFETAVPPMGYGDVFNTDDIPGGVLGTLTSSTFLTLSENSSRTATSVNRNQLVSFSNRQSEVIHNNGNPVDIDATKAYIEQVNTNADNGRKFLSDHRDVDRGSLGPTEEAPYIEADNQIREKRDLDLSMQNARSNTRERFKKQAQYRMMDATLWTKDHNIFPGFSYMLLEGSGTQKNVAIALYIKNGLINSQFFGKDVAFLQKIETETGISAMDWIAILGFGRDLISNSKTGGMSADNVLINASGTHALDAIGRFVSVHSENWFGFKIDPDYVQGLVVSATTGKWGLSIGSSNRTVTSTASDGKAYTFDTLGGVFVKKEFDKMVNKAFSWADHQTGWKPGTAYEIFNTARQIFQAVDTLKKLRTYGDLLRGGPVGALAGAVYLEKNPKIAALVGEKGLQGAKDEQARGLVDLAAKYATKAAMRWIDAQAGQEIAEFENRNSLVPGSTSLLIESVVSYGAVNAATWIYNQAFGGELHFLGPAGMYAALAMFIAINLFGYYDTDLKCSADGYYPEIGSPSITTDSNSGLGTWDGMDETASKDNTIASAQYKAKRLILDVLEMHKNPLYKDTYASQIMTGRNETVLEINDQITENMCSKIGLVSIAGICGGNTQAGVWENLQTTTYTHIGF